MSVLWKKIEFYKGTKIENQGITFIRINPDPDSDASFDPDVEIAKIYNHINKSSLKLAVILAKNV